MEGKKKKKETLPPAAALETRPSRSKRSRPASFEKLVSRVFPSRRAERGYTLRKEYREDGPETATDLVFGMVDSQKLHNGEDVKDDQSRLVEKIAGNASHQVVGDKGSGPNSHRSGAKDATKEDVHRLAESGTIHRRISEGGRVKEKRHGSLRRFFSLRKDSKSSDRKDLRNDARSQQEKPVPLLHMPNLEKEPRRLSLKEETVEKKEESETQKAQRMLEEKKAQREQRRRLQESGDFLGVQGANPRTGYWDISTATSSSQPSQLSDDTKRKLVQQEKHAEEQRIKFEEQKSKYEKARAMYRAELARVHKSNDNRAREKAEQKKREMRLRQRRYGRWKSGENGWSSVAEPALSPIQQSLAGSPRGTAPGDRLFPMPSADNPTPYINPNHIGQQDYFGHRSVSSPLARDRYNALVESASTTSGRRIVEMPRRQRRKRNYSSGTVLHKDSSYDSIDEILSNNPPFPPSRRPSDVLDAPATERSSPKEQSRPTEQSSAALPVSLRASQSDNFLEEALFLPQLYCQYAGEATATLSPLVLTSQVLTFQLYSRSPEELNPRRGITALNKLAPVSPKDLVAMQIPSSSQVQKDLTVMEPLATSRIWPGSRGSSTTIIPTIIITGYGPVQRLFTGFRLIAKMEVTQRHQFLEGKSNRISLQTNSHQNGTSKVGQSTACQTHQVDIATSSYQMMVRISRFCRKLIPNGEKVRMTSTPTSISMSRQNSEKPEGVEHKPNLLQHRSSGNLEIKGATEARNRRSQTHRNLFRRTTGRVTHIIRAFKLLPRGLGDIGGPFKTRNKAWHNVENEGKELSKELPRGRHTARLGPGRVGLNSNGIFQTQWLLPIFSPHSDIRRQAEQRLNWQDVGLFLAATVFRGQ